MNVNQKGIKGLIKTIDILQDMGYYTFPAFDDHSPIDLIAVDKQGQVYRLQVKYRAKDYNNKYLISTQSVVNGKRILINRSLIDGWAVYLKEDNKVMFIAKRWLDNKKHLTVYPNKNYGEMGEWFKPSPC